MLYYDRIDVDKKSESKECDTRLYQKTLNKGCMFQSNVCGGFL